MKSLITSPASAGPMFQLKMKVYFCVSGESHAQESLAGYSPWGHKELDTIEMTQHAPYGAYHVFMKYVKHPYEVDTIITSILQVRD